MIPSSRKRIRSDLSNSDDETNEHVYSDDEHESNLSKKLEVNYPKFIVLKPVYSDQPLTKLSPFAVAKSIQGRFGTVNQVKKMKDGSLLIEASRNSQAKEIMDTHNFLDIDVDAEANRSLNTSKGVIRDFHQDLKDMSDEEIKKELSSQGVTNVARFILKKDNKEIKTNTLFLTFAAHVPPEKIKIGYYIANVQLYIPRGAQFVHMRMPTICWKTFPAKTTKMLSTRNSSILIMSSSVYLFFASECSFTK